MWSLIPNQNAFSSYVVAQGRTLVLCPSSRKSYDQSSVTFARNARSSRVLSTQVPKNLFTGKKLSEVIFRHKYSACFVLFVARNHRWTLSLPPPLAPESNPKA